ncbi:hypothetical protein VNO77_03049 [Canavalia gladiata]|uniref:PPM-type phosphatase domain-containing protein n=1 Tax=Canavalia gladiata TaxID=3824 RepID=A0AAN9R3I4_CANGL
MIYFHVNRTSDDCSFADIDLDEMSGYKLCLRTLVTGFVKTDKEFLNKEQVGREFDFLTDFVNPHLVLSIEISGTTPTFVIVDRWTVTVVSVGDSRCILDIRVMLAITSLTVDHRLGENIEERERVTASGGEVGRLSIVGGAEIGPFDVGRGGLCLSRSIGDMDVGEFIVPMPYQMLVRGLYLLLMAYGMLYPQKWLQNLAEEAPRTRGLKDDTTCLIVDIILPDNELPPTPPQRVEQPDVTKNGLNSHYL